MDKKVFQKLKNLTSEFKSNDIALGETLRMNGGDFEDLRIEEIWSKAVEIICEIKLILGDEPLLQIHDVELRSILRKIRDNEGFLIFNIYRILYGEDCEFEPIDWKMLYDRFHEKLHFQASPYSIVRGQMEIGTIILSNSVPSYFQSHLEKIRDCFCFNFPTAASIWCRSLLEVGIKESLKRKGLIRRNSKIRDIGEKNLQWLIEQCKSFCEPNIIQKMHNIRREVNKLLHSEKIGEEKINHLKIIKDTFKILEAIF